jgi:HNH endonuclease
MLRCTGPWEYYSHKVQLGHPDDCWEWKDSLSSNGYGNWCHNKKIGTAHRATYKLFFGDPGNLLVNHKCGNRKCCNPDHLYAGTYFQNHIDAINHGKHIPPPYKRGESVGTSKLTYENVKMIKEELKNGKSSAELGRKFGVTSDTIYKIKIGKNWSWV